MADTPTDTRAENHLAQTTSPYLLQHRTNPVDWYPWNTEALSKAERENKPILLSVGYAACHWCHVMAHESFENPDIASLMNANYVNIKVDREERPDLDSLYQAALQSLGEQGGWPLTMFLTPKREPFWGGTYFPPVDRYNRPGFAKVLTEIARIYREDPAKIARNAEGITSGLSRLAQPAPGTPPQLADMDRMAQAAVPMIDPVLGGLRGAPKFPHVPLLTFLWHAYLRTGARNLRHAVVTSCAAMCQGGIYDHLAGGFARYSTDDRWLAPHFEKMLYDNAQLIDLLTLVWQETREPLLRQRIQETIAWILRDMIGEGGAFAATVDADSEGEEGKFAVWTVEEITTLLGKDAPAFRQIYDVRPEGNWEGKTILNRLQSPAFGTDDEEAALADMRAVLLAARDKRIPPGRDDKILSDWNGLAIAAIAQAGAVFDEPAWIEAARKAFDFVYLHMQPEGRLAHALRLGRIGAAGLIDDHAAMARAALALHAATGKTSYIDNARKWVDDADRLFWDDRGGAEGGGYFLAADDARDLLVRAKSPFDNATPAGNNIMLGVLAKLHLLTGMEDYRRRADALARAFAGAVEQRTIEMATYLTGIALLQSGPQIIIVGTPDDSGTKALLAAARAVSLPEHILMRTTPGDTLPEGHPAAGKGLNDGRATAYVCRGPVCSTPVTEPAALRAKLLDLRTA